MKTFPLFAAALVIAAPATAAQKAAPAQADNATNQSQGATGVTSIVDAEFPAYDANSTGALEQPEFIKWMVALKQQELKTSGKTLPAAEITAWASGAFTSADADGNGAVSKPELILYLTGSSK